MKGRDTELGGVYMAALANAADTSDAVLLATKILEESLPKNETSANLIMRIQQLYLESSPQALEVISNLIRSELDNPGLLNALNNNRLVDDQQKNYSRRYFETTFSNQMWHALDHSIYKSLEIFAKMMKSKNDSISVPAYVTSSADAEKAIGAMREFGEKTPSIGAGERSIRDSSELAKTKDRGDKRAASNDVLYSVNPGIMKASQPSPVDERTKLEKNRVVDSFKISEKNPGYSTKRKDVPFVNSVSGTAYTLAAVLNEFVANYNDGSKSELQQHVNNIALSFVAFTCKSGYHSLSEMIDVLKDPSVIGVFKNHGLEINLNFPQKVIDFSFSKSVEYTKEICLKRGVVEELHDISATGNIMGVLKMPAQDPIVVPCVVDPLAGIAPAAAVRAKPDAFISLAPDAKVKSDVSTIPVAPVVMIKVK